MSLKNFVVSLVVLLLVLCLPIAWLIIGGYAVQKPVFIKAVEQGRYWQVSAMLAYNPELANQSDCAVSPLILAARHKNWNMVNIIFNKGKFDLKYVFYSALEERDKEMLEYCLSRSRLNFKTGNFQLKMPNLIKENNREIIQVMLENGFDLARWENLLLVESVKNKNKYMLDFFLSKGCDLDDLNEEETEYFVKYIDLHGLELCIEKGFDIETHCDGMLAHAVRANRPKQIIAFLMEQGADLDLLDPALRAQAEAIMAGTPLRTLTRVSP